VIPVFPSYAKRIVVRKKMRGGLSENTDFSAKKWPIEDIKGRAHNNRSLYALSEDEKCSEGSVELLFKKLCRSTSSA
jgi:hypothetical protein